MCNDNSFPIVLILIVVLIIFTALTLTSTAEPPRLASTFDALGITPTPALSPAPKLPPRSTPVLWYLVFITKEG